MDQDVSDQSKSILTFRADSIERLKSFSEYHTPRRLISGHSDAS
jgi:hypothetical protein